MNPAKLRIRIDLGTVGRVPLRGSPLAQPETRNPKPETTPAQTARTTPHREPKTIDIKLAHTVHRLRYWKTRWTNKKTRRVYTSYVLAYHDGLKPRREKRNSYKAIRARAEEIATQKENGETARLQLTPADQASYLRARELLAPIGKPLEIAVGDYTQCVQILSGRASLIEACRDYLARHPAGTAPKDIPVIVTELLQRRKLGTKWKRMLKNMLERFAVSFTGPITSLTAPAVDDWLEALKDKHARAINLRTRRNYFEAVVSLARFAKIRGYAPADWNIFADVSNPDPRKTKVHIYTPQAFAYLLNFAESYGAGRKVVPLMAITAFAGVRHGEMNEEKIEHLDWKNVRFRTERIIIGEDDEAKTNRKRVVDMPKNLVAWLKPYARPTGRICVLKHTANAMCQLRKKAVKELRAQAEKVGNSERRRDLLEIAEELAGPKKNALRKSFISYKKALTGDIERVAEAAGNSPKVIRDTYLHVDEDMKEDAERWFTIGPERADVLPLFAWARPA